MSVKAMAAEQAPQWRPIPAQLFRQRNGLGNVFAKLKAGKEVRIAYFGGSITAQEGWRPKTLKWFRDTYPQAKVSEINAAIGGTGSDLGVYRAQQDVLSHKPDLIFVEFSVNDGGAAPENIWRGMEGIVRQAWKADPDVDICYVYTFAVGQEKSLDQGVCARAASSDEILADYYGIPSINMAMRAAELARQGKLIYTPHKDAAGKELPTPPGVILFSTDGVHPLDAGHEVYTQVITDALKQMEPTSQPGPHHLRPPFIADNWENAKLVPLNPAMLSSGWHKLSPTEGLGKTFHDRLPEMWEATKPGEKITFKFTGTAVKLYDILGPDGGQVICTVDGKSNRPQPRFDSYSSYHRLASLPIAEGLADTVHTVSVEIQPEQPDRSSVVNVEKNKPGFDPKKYEGTAVRVGYIMVLGDVVQG
ncbi:MAG: SGNH/GDSL hydrolase family protein [Abitibacteriaceae bacterium]|nr:SGNH/GDSL hydrolase family protein [Abditibacteriaceae bacterium]